MGWHPIALAICPSRLPTPQKAPPPVLEAEGANVREGRGGLVWEAGEAIADGGDGEGVLAEGEGRGGSGLAPSSAVPKWNN